jgi:DNA-binding NarL/FixJ family response regulator
MRVLLADDHEFVRRGVRAILASSSDCQLIAETATGDEAVRLAILHRPDVAVLDVRMPVLNGIAAASRIAERSPGTAVLMLSLSEDAQHIAGALAAGAHGYVGKSEATEHLLRAVFAVGARNYYLSPSAADSMKSFAASPSFGALEREVLALFDRYAAALLGCAAASGAGEHAATTLHQTFLAYLLARAGAQHIPSAAAWLFASVAAFAYERSSVPSRASDVSAIRSWCRARLQPHPAISAFVTYWTGGMRDSSRRRLVEHVRRCPLCHLEWCLAASASAPLATPEGAAVDRIPGLRAQLAKELRKCDLGVLAASLREHNRRLNVLLASELDMVFGAAAASHWISDASPRRQFASPLIAEFLGAHTASLAATVRSAASPA